jgi:hypothetical protein
MTGILSNKPNVIIRTTLLKKNDGILEKVKYKKFPMMVEEISKHEN